MSARNVDHPIVVESLIHDGWTITHDPLRLPFGRRDIYIDLGAERVTVAATKDTRRIAVEIQSLSHPSPVRALEEALGQYQLYREILSDLEPDRILYMATSRTVHTGILSDPVGQYVITRFRIRLVVYDAVSRRIVQWIE